MKIITPSAAILLVLAAPLPAAVYPTGGGYAQQFTMGNPVIIGPGVTSAAGLPPGLVFPGIYGADYISGTPTTAGIYTGTINGLPFKWLIATHSDGWAWMPEHTSLLVGVPSTLQLTPVLLVGSALHPPHQYYLFYDFWPGYPYTAFPTTMPPGLTLNSDGSITGTPTTTGTWEIEIAGLDAGYSGPIAGLRISVNSSGGTTPPPPVETAQHRTTVRSAAAKGASVR